MNEERCSSCGQYVGHHYECSPDRKYEYQVCQNCKKRIRTWEGQPLTIYSSIPAGMLSSGDSILVDFGANPQNKKVDLLYDLDESGLKKEILTQPKLLASILKKLGIDYPSCWIALDVPTKEKLIKDWEYDKPGDVDMIAGNMKDKLVSLDYIVGVQVKIRKVEAFGKLRPFPSGTGTKQAHYTALMGFDRTMLYHLIVREPQPVSDGIAPSWNPIINSDFINATKACSRITKERLKKKGKLSFGYGLIGWGQAYCEEWQNCGGFFDEIVIEPPFRPLQDNMNVEKSRRSLKESLKNLFTEEVTSVPYIWKSSRE